MVAQAREVDGALVVAVPAVLAAGAILDLTAVGRIGRAGQEGLGAPSSIATMGWATDARDALRAGRTVKVRPLGGSIRGRIESGQLVTISPVKADEARVGDVVFVRWHEGFLLHLVKGVRDGEVRGGVSRPTWARR